jgi:hypothetical protein
MAKTYEQFKQNLLRSLPPVFIVGHSFSEMGFDIFIPSIKVRPKTGSKFEDYQDDGDLHVTKKNKTTKINVKQSSRIFSNVEDWPFPTMFVAEKHIIDGKYGDIIGLYVTVSADNKFAAAINPRKTKNSWKVRKVYEPKYDITTTVYEVDKNKVRFFQL